VGDIVEVFGIGGDLLEQAPSGLDVSQILLALILAPPRLEQAVRAPDGFQGAMAEGEIDLRESDDERRRWAVAGAGQPPAVRGAEAFCRADAAGRGNVRSVPASPAADSGGATCARWERWFGTDAPWV